MKGVSRLQWHGDATLLLDAGLVKVSGLGMKRQLVFGWLWFAAVSVQACTIFVLTDTNRVLFCNNEDALNPMTRIWFVPASEGRYGCAYVGFDNSWGQGGLNTEGLAYDWVAGWNEKWEPGAGQERIEGNPAERMLATCATLDEAVAFFRKHYEPGFGYARILVADKTGASAMIRAKDGKLFVDPANQCRGFGYGERTLDQMLATSPEATVANGMKILRACVQPLGTRYSNVYDLKSGDILVFRPSEVEMKLNLAVELKKGAHYYDIPQIREQLKQALRPIAGMKRFVTEAFQAGPDPEPKVTAQFRKMLGEAIRGEMLASDYAPEFWKRISGKQKETRADLNALGDLISIKPVERSTEAKERCYWYRVEFTKGTVFQIVMLDADNRVKFSDSVDTHHKTQTAANSSN